MYTRLLHSVVCLLLVASTPAWCGNSFPGSRKTSSVASLHLSFQSIKQGTFDPVYNDFSGRLRSISWKTNKIKRILASYEDPAWVKKNIKRIVKGGFQNDMGDVTVGLDMEVVRDIWRKRDQMTELQDKVEEAASIISRLKQIPVKRNSEHDIKIKADERDLDDMRRRLVNLRAVGDVVVQLHEDLFKWIVGPRYSLPAREPFDARDYLRALVSSPRTNARWISWRTDIETWLYQNVPTAFLCLQNYSYDPYRRSLECASDPLFMEYKMKSILRYEFKWAIEQGLMALGIDGKVAMPFDGILLEFKDPELYVPEDENAARLKMTWKGEGKNKGFGINELLRAGLNPRRASSSAKTHERMGSRIISEEGT